MAVLKSEEQEVLSAFELIPVSGPAKEGNEWWQAVSVVLTSGAHCLSLGSKGKNKESCLLCRQPNDEAYKLKSMLRELVDDKRKQVLFEPSEPSFELFAERTKEGGIGIYVWLDSGNASTGFYRWDAVGVRFYTTQTHLLSFIEELTLDFDLRAGEDCL